MARIKTKKRVPYLSHGSEGMVQLGERLVQDPLEPGARLRATVNVRESSIDHMASRGRINTSQAEAGQRFRKIWEMAAIGRSQGMDTTKEFVDGGGIGDPISDALVKAAEDLKHVMRVLGPVGSSLVVSIVGEGKRIEDVAKGWSQSGGPVRGERAEGYVTGRMVEALDELVRYWKLESAPISQNAPKTYRRNGKLVSVSDDIRSCSDGHTGPAVELTVGRFGDVVESSQRPLDRAAMIPHVAGSR